MRNRSSRFASLHLLSQIPPPFINPVQISHFHSNLIFQMLFVILILISLYTTHSVSLSHYLLLWLCAVD